MKIELTAIFQKVAEGCIAFVEELPGANSQGGTLDEARSNLKEAIQLVLESNREIAEEEIKVGMAMKTVANTLPNGQLNYVFQKP